MRFFSVPRTVACADKIMLNIIDTYFSQNCTGREPAVCWPPNIHSEELAQRRRTEPPVPCVPRGDKRRIAMSEMMKVTV